MRIPTPALRLAVFLLWTLALVPACGGGMESAALNCWGAGSDASADCKAAKRYELAALVLVPSVLPDHFLDPAAAQAPCGPTISCDGSAPVVATAQPVSDEPDTPAPIPTKSAVALVAEPVAAVPPEEKVATPTPAQPAAAPAVPTPEPAVEPPSPPTPAPRPESVEDSRVASAGPDPCVGVQFEGIENKRSLNSTELSCLRDTVAGKRETDDVEVQVAALALHNTRSSGWQKSVEKALKRSGLKNSPLLNFAAIKPAYDRGRYKAVLKRARKVWRNIGKGYQLDRNDRGFLVEYSCRAAGQLALSGEPANDGLDWCERWLDHAERSGQGTAAILDLIDQLE